MLYRGILLCVLMLASLVACDHDRTNGLSVLAQPRDILDDIMEKKELVVATRNAPTTYYNLHDEETGFEYEMVQSFAASLGVQVRVLVKDSTSELFSAIEKGEAHIAAAGLTRTQEREPLYLFGPEYQKVQQQVICRRGGANPKNISDLIGIELAVPVDTSYVEALQHFAKQHTDLSWKTDSGRETEDMLELVWQKKIDCTIADSNIVAINRRYYPELKVRFDLTDPEPLGWVMPKDADSLAEKVSEWFGNYRQSGEMDILLEKYYGHIEMFDYVDTRKFVKRIYHILPDYRSFFESAGKRYNMDWTLLAAQAYQESHWRANAKSPTGVRGIMMLTRNTARELGVQQRTDANQSIHGGAKYLSDLLERIPQSVTGDDRIWFALAAYNVGIGHIHDARTLAKRLDKNPDLWLDVQEMLPLLSKKKYYKTLKNGYARGREPVRYVQRIRDYHDILLKRLNLI